MIGISGILGIDFIFFIVKVEMSTVKLTQRGIIERKPRQRNECQSPCVAMRNPRGTCLMKRQERTHLPSKHSIVAQNSNKPSTRPLTRLFAHLKSLIRLLRYARSLTDSLSLKHVRKRAIRCPRLYWTIVHCLSDESFHWRPLWWKWDRPFSLVSLVVNPIIMGSRIWLGLKLDGDPQNDIHDHERTSRPHALNRFIMLHFLILFLPCFLVFLH